MPKGIQVKGTKTILPCLGGLLAIVGSALANPGHELLRGQSQAERATTLAGILHASGKACAEVSRSFYQGEDEHRAAYWNAACSGGEAYVIQIPPDSQTRVIECQIVELIGVACFTRFGE